MLHHIPWHHIIDVGTEVVAVCSVAHTALPPWDWNPDFVKEGMADFPSAQSVFRGIFHNRWYKLLIYVIGYVALNGRSTIWRAAISMPNQIAKAMTEAKADPNVQGSGN